MTALKKGEMSAPVKSQFGYHIIKLEDTREAKFPDFAEVKPQVVQRLEQAKIRRFRRRCARRRRRTSSSRGSSRHAEVASDQSPHGDRRAGFFIAAGNYARGGNALPEGGWWPRIFTFCLAGMPGQANPQCATLLFVLLRRLQIRGPEKLPYRSSTPHASHSLVAAFHVVFEALEVALSRPFAACRNQADLCFSHWQTSPLPCTWASPLGSVAGAQRARAAGVLAGGQSLRHRTFSPTRRRTLRPQSEPSQLFGPSQRLCPCTPQAVQT